MLSSQRNRLLFLANELESRYFNMNEYANAMRCAADTIGELRNKLDGMVDQSEEIDKRTAELDFQIADNWRLTAVNESLKEQNAKLKEQVHWLKKGDILHVLTDQEFADQQKREREMQASIAALEEENAKLDRIRRSLHADVLWLGGIIHRRNDENDKLRELLRNALTYIECEGCGVECPETGHGATLTPCDICNRYETESCAYVIAQSAREWGIEVE